MAKEKSFRIKEEYNIGTGHIRIVVDDYTGVNYIITHRATMSGITPLLAEMEI